MNKYESIKRNRCENTYQEYIKIAYYVKINIILLITIIIFFMKKMNIIHYLKTILTQRLLLEI